MLISYKQKWRNVSVSVSCKLIQIRCLIPLLGALLFKRPVHPADKDVVCAHVWMSFWVPVISFSQHACSSDAAPCPGVCSDTLLRLVNILVIFSLNWPSSCCQTSLKFCLRAMQCNLYANRFQPSSLSCRALFIYSSVFTFQETIGQYDVEHYNIIIQ